MRTRTPERKQSGFVLVLTLWILAAITIAASYFADRVQKSLQLAQLRQGFNEKQIGMNNTRSEILFRLGTNYFSQNGLGFNQDTIFLDGRLYGGGGNTVQLLDARALIDLNQVKDDQLFRFLGVMNVPADQRANLIDTLHDYTDEDDLRRLNGAEAKEYLEHGLSPPRNGPLISPMELKNIIGWRDMSALWQTVSVADLTTVGTAVTINPNTASWQVLASLPGVTPEIAQAIIARRRLGPVDVALVSQIAGVDMQTFPPMLIAFPSDNVRVTQRADGLPWAIRYNIQLTPQSSIAPWQINYFYRLEENPDPTRPIDAVNPADITKFPPRSVLSAEPAYVPSF